MMQLLLASVSASAIAAGGGGGGGGGYSGVNQFGWTFTPLFAVTPANYSPGYTGLLQRDDTGPRSGTSCLQIDANGGGLNLPDTDATRFDLGTGDFTIELWIKRSGVPSAYSQLIGKYYSPVSSNRCWRLGYDPGAKRMNFNLTSSGSTTVRTAYHALNATTEAALFDGNWHHVAVMRTGGTLSVHIDGAACSNPFTTFGTDAVRNSTSIPTSVGVGLAQVSFQPSYRNSFVGGKIDDVRVTKGVARYTAPFTPPAGAYPTGGADPHWANVAVLLDFETPNWGIATGGALLSPVQTLGNYSTDIGTSYSDGLGWRLNATQNWQSRYEYFPGMDLGSNDFTVEAVVHLYGSSQGAILGPQSNTNGYDCWGLWRGPSNQIQFRYTPDGNPANEVQLVVVPLVTLGVDSHISVSRVGSTLYGHLNGVKVSEQAITGAIHSGFVNGVGFGVNAVVNPSTTNYLSANSAIRGFRVSTGEARYGAANFTVPALADLLT